MHIAECVVIVCVYMQRKQVKQLQDEVQDNEMDIVSPRN